MREKKRKKKNPLGVNTLLILLCVVCGKTAGDLAAFALNINYEPHTASPVLLCTELYTICSIPKPVHCS